MNGTSKGPAKNDTSRDDVTSLQETLRRVLLDLWRVAVTAGGGVDAPSYRDDHREWLEDLAELERRRCILRVGDIYRFSPVGLVLLQDSDAAEAVLLGDQIWAALRSHFKDPTTRHKPIALQTLSDRLRIDRDRLAFVLLHLGEAVGFWCESWSDFSQTNATLTPKEECLKEWSVINVARELVIAAERDSRTPEWTQERIGGDVTSARRPIFTKGQCPKCGPERRAEVTASYEDSWEDRYVSGTETYNILKCGGCEAVYIQHVSTCSEDADYSYDENGETVATLVPRFAYWPPQTQRARPQWSETLEDETLRDVLGEVYGALDADHRILAAIGARTALDRAMVLNGANGR